MLPQNRQSNGACPEQSQKNHHADDRGKQTNARDVVLEQDVPNQADIQIFVRAVRSQVKVGVPILYEVNARPGLASIEAQVQMSSTEARDHQAHARQIEEKATYRGAGAGNLHRRSIVESAQGSNRLVLLVAERSL